MGNTKIEWTDRVWNPVTGCSPVSEGCRNCYAKRMAHRLRGRYGYPKDDPFRVTFHPGRLDEPLKWKKDSKVFVCSMADLFHENVQFEWIGHVWDAIFNRSFPDRIANKPYHTFLILTKRPCRVLQFEKWLEKDNRNVWYDNIWLGVSVENQQTADERIPVLLQIPAAKKFVSVEPMLGFVDFQWDIYTDDIRPDWVICGAETGPGARPMNPDWARSLRDQCRAAGVPFFFKQMSKKAPIPKDLMIREYPE